MTYTPPLNSYPLQVCKSAAGFYIGTLTADGFPYSRESREYWAKKKDAEAALRGDAPWTQRTHY